MPATYEALSQGGHEAMATEIFTKIKTYLDTHGADSKVSKAGDTMTGVLAMKDEAIDASKSNNNISSTRYPTTFNILDTANRILSRMECVVESNGNISSYWYTRNYNTSGGQVAQKGIKMTMNKRGTLTYSVSDGEAFATAIGKYTRSSTGTLDWGSTNQQLLMTKSAVAYWNGCYSGTSSNLQYCDRGRFGTIVTKGSGDYIATTGGNITGTNRFKLNNSQEIYQNENYLILGTSNMVCVRTYNNINAAKTIQAASFQTYSSRLIKKNITDITQDEAKSLLNLRVVDFDYIEQVGGQTNQTGIIAEEALTVYPKCVEIPENYDEDEVKKAIKTGDAINAMNVDYTKLIAPLIKLVQIQQKEIDEIKERRSYETTR